MFCLIGFNDDSNNFLTATMSKSLLICLFFGQLNNITKGADFPTTTQNLHRK